MSDVVDVSPTIDEISDLRIAETRVCASCGRPEAQWRENGGEGYSLGDDTYCCRGCADETGCTCV